jgi:hypothetical protein
MKALSVSEGGHQRPTAAKRDCWPGAVAAAEGGYRRAESDTGAAIFAAYAPYGGVTCRFNLGAREGVKQRERTP